MFVCNSEWWSTTRAQAKKFMWIYLFSQGIIKIIGKSFGIPTVDFDLEEVVSVIKLEQIMKEINMIKI